MALVIKFHYSSNIFCRLIVTGDSAGHIKFYDKAIKLLYWCQDISLPPIASISFDINPRLYVIKDPAEFVTGRRIYT